MAPINLCVAAVLVASLGLTAAGDDEKPKEKLTVNIQTSSDSAHVSGNVVYMHKNARVTLQCLGDNEAAWVKTLFKDPNVELDERNQATTTLIARSMTENSGVYTCYQRKRQGTATRVPMDNATVTVFVSDATGWSSRFDVTKLPYNVSFQLQCPVAKKDDTIKWMHNGAPVVLIEDITTISSAGVLSVKKPVSYDTGVYSCDRYNSADVLQERRLFEVSGNATARDMEVPSKNLREDDEVEFHCKVFGYPLPEIQWHRIKADTSERQNLTIKEIEKEGSDLKGRVRFETYHGMKGAQIRLTGLKKTDSGTYVCGTRNKFNRNVWSESSIILRVKDKLAFLVPLIGICVEVVLLCLIIFLYERRRSKQEADEDTDAKKGLTTSENVDVRHRLTSKT